MATSIDETAEATAETTEDSDKVPDWMLAKQGINMFINNNSAGAQELFRQYPDNIVLFGGYSVTIFMDALLSFEEDKLTLATSVLKEVERRCSTESGWFKSVKKAFSSVEVQTSLSELLETQIILADSQVCLAILTFLQQDISSYLKGGWVLRKAWKVYQAAYHEILQLHMEIVGDSNLQLPEVAAQSTATSPVTSSDIAEENNPLDLQDDANSPNPPQNGYLTKISHSHSAILIHQPTTQNSGSSTPNSARNTRNTDRSLFTSLKKSLSVNSALSKHTLKPERNYFAHSLSFSYIASTFHLFSSADKLKSSQIDRPTIQRLMGAVSFGYGLLQLGMSLLPPSLLKFSNILGFGGNRQNGIACLMYARGGIDTRAPLATLALLWFHTIVRPFYALDGSNVQAGVSAASELLLEAEAEYSQSALFLFFKGRVNRLKSDIPTALKCFQLSVENSSQREIKLLSLHEVGWCHLIQLDYCNAETTFSYLKTWSRWSRAFYSYLSCICCGSCNGTDCPNIKDMYAALSSRKANQLDEFLMRRVNCCPSDDEIRSHLPSIFWKLLVYELLYLWNALPSCSTENIENIKADCEEILNEPTSVEPMLGLSNLILGCCYCVQRNYPVAMEKFRTCLDKRKNLANNAADAHVSAFSQYELGALMVKCKESKEEAKSLLQNISHYKDYDFEQRLNVRVHSLMKLL